MEKNTEEGIKKVLESKIAVRILYCIGIAIVAMLIFHAGITVGFQKALYGRAWGEHYNENFGIGRPFDMGMHGGMINGIGMMGYFPDAHGATGKIIKIEPPNIIVADMDNTEKIIATDTDTKIEEGRMDIGIKDLKIEDFIVTIGAPSDKGIIQAKFIRVIPSPEFLNQ